MKARIIIFEDMGDRQDWGDYEFVTLPCVRDTVTVAREGAARRLSVMEVLHHPRRPDEARAPDVQILAEPWRA